MKFNVALEVTCYLLYEELPVSFVVFRSILLLYESYDCLFFFYDKSISIVSAAHFATVTLGVHFFIRHYTRGRN